MTVHDDNKELYVVLTNYYLFSPKENEGEWMKKTNFLTVSSFSFSVAKRYKILNWSRCRHRCPRWRGMPCARHGSRQWRSVLGCRWGRSTCCPGCPGGRTLAWRRCLGRRQSGIVQRRRILGCTWNPQYRWWRCWLHRTGIQLAGKDPRSGILPRCGVKEQNKKCALDGEREREIGQREVRKNRKKRQKKKNE